MTDHSSEVFQSRSLTGEKNMSVPKQCKTRVIGKSISALRSAKQALYAAAALHTIVPLLLLTGLVIPLVVSAHG